MEIKKSTMYLIIGAIIVLGLFGIVAAGDNEDSITGAATQTTKSSTTNSGEYQTVKLSFVNYEYIMEPSELKEGIPVRMEVDMNTVYGCMRDIVIGSFGVRKYVTANDNIVEFTPDKTGTFNIVCSMNMGRGKFTVVNNEGTTSGYVEQAPVSTGGSCGSSGGGCGCGGY